MRLEQILIKSCRLQKKKKKEEEVKGGYGRFAEAEGALQSWGCWAGELSPCAALPGHCTPNPPARAGLADQGELQQREGAGKSPPKAKENRQRAIRPWLK